MILKEHKSCNRLLSYSQVARPFTQDADRFRTYNYLYEVLNDYMCLDIKCWVHVISEKSKIYVNFPKLSTNGYDF